MRREDMRRWARDTKVGPSARIVGLMLMCHANPDGEAWPAISTLVVETHLSRRQVQRALRELEAAGDVVTVPRTGDISVYRLTMTRDTGDAPTRDTGDAPRGDMGDAEGRHTARKGATPVSPRSVEVKKEVAKARATGAASPRKAAAPRDPRGILIPNVGWIRDVD